MTSSAALRLRQVVKIRPRLIMAFRSQVAIRAYKLMPKMVEREGFEPSIELRPYNGFAIGGFDLTCCVLATFRRPTIA